MKLLPLLCIAFTAFSVTGLALPPHNGQRKFPPPGEANFTAMIKPRKPVSDIACGVAHSIVLTKDGGAYGFGLNDFGQADVKIPAGVKQVAAGDRFSAVVMNSGELKLFGRIEKTDKLPMTGVKEVAAGGRSIAAADVSNSIFFGGDLHAAPGFFTPELVRMACGRGGAMFHLPYYRTVSAGSAPAIPGQTWIKGCVCGDSAATIDEKGRCHFYGNSPLRVPSLDKVLDVLVLDNQTAVLTTDGRLEVRYHNNYKERPLADERVITTVLKRKDAVAVRGSTSGGGMAVIFSNGDVLAWGYDQFGMFAFDWNPDDVSQIYGGADQRWGAVYLKASDGRFIGAGPSDEYDPEGYYTQSCVPSGLQRRIGSVAAGDSFVCISLMDRPGVIGWGRNYVKECEVELAGKPRLMCATLEHCFAIDDKNRLVVSGPDPERFRTGDFPLKEVVHMNSACGVLSLITKDGKLLAKSPDPADFTNGELRLESVAEAYGMDQRVAVRFQDGSVSVHDGKEMRQVCGAGESKQIFANWNGLYVLQPNGDCLQIPKPDQGERKPILEGKPKISIGGGEYFVFGVRETGELLMTGKQKSSIPWIWGEPARMSPSAAAPAPKR